MTGFVPPCAQSGGCCTEVGTAGLWRSSPRPHHEEVRRRPPLSVVLYRRCMVHSGLSPGRGGQAVSTLAFQQCELGSIHGRVPEFLHVGIVPDDAVGWRVFSGISRFPRPFIPALLHTHLNTCSEPPKTLHFIAFSFTLTFSQWSKLPAILKACPVECYTIYDVNRGFCMSEADVVESCNRFEKRPESSSALGMVAVYVPTSFYFSFVLTFLISVGYLDHMRSVVRALVLSRMSLGTILLYSYSPQTTANHSTLLRVEGILVSYHSTPEGGGMIEMEGDPSDNTDKGGHPHEFYKMSLVPQLLPSGLGTLRWEASRVGGNRLSRSADDGYNYNRGDGCFSPKFHSKSTKCVGRRCGATVWMADRPSAEINNARGATQHVAWCVARALSRMHFTCRAHKRDGAAASSSARNVIKQAGISATGRGNVQRADCSSAFGALCVRDVIQPLD
ncbi:hypothetical protein PR048_002478 [Dryococelus australis]|uniref:Uncharacterized protein n=1 Tax=Dryococelus australis TaxID=614101 RepID=A0ABQ9IKG2_9NEOP|nr:hypothetical protein PR048_002478 [Dryococelus australis]